MRRRKFLKLLGIGSLVSYGGLYLFTDFRSRMLQLLKAETASLRVSEQAMEAFLRDADAEKFWQQFSFLKKEFFRAHLVADTASLPLPFKAKYEEYRRQLVGTFLLSTDFFHNRMDARKPVRYIGFYNPYKRACGSPFSNLYYPSN